jgi:hypothetical protein
MLENLTLRNIKLGLNPLTNTFRNNILGRTENYASTYRKTCYSEGAYLREVAYYGTTEADRETWMQNSPIQRATVPTHPPAGTHATPGAHLCSTGLQAAERATESHIPFLTPITSNAAQSGLVTPVN